MYFYLVPKTEKQIYQISDPQNLQFGFIGVRLVAGTPHGSSLLAEPMFSADSWQTKQYKL